jgi:hypothetical protein
LTDENRFLAAKIWLKTVISALDQPESTLRTFFTVPISAIAAPVLAAFVIGCMIPLPFPKLFCATHVA